MPVILKDIARALDVRPRVVVVSREELAQVFGLGRAADQRGGRCGLLTRRRGPERAKRRPGEVTPAVGHRKNQIAGEPVRSRPWSTVSRFPRLALVHAPKK